MRSLKGATPPAVTANLLTGLGIDKYFTRQDSGGNVSTFLGDGLGSTVGLVGSAGTIATSYTYQPFGATTVSGAANVYEYTGRENDGSPGGAKRRFPICGVSVDRHDTHDGSRYPF